MASRARTPACGALLPARRFPLPAFTAAYDHPAGLSVLQPVERAFAAVIRIAVQGTVDSAANPGLVPLQSWYLGRLCTQRHTRISESVAIFLATAGLVQAVGVALGRGMGL